MAVKVQHPNHWTTREFPPGLFIFLKELISQKYGSKAFLYLHFFLQVTDLSIFSELLPVNIFLLSQILESFVQLLLNGYFFITSNDCLLTSFSQIRLFIHQMSSGLLGPAACRPGCQSYLCPGCQSYLCPSSCEAVAKT